MKKLFALLLVFVMAALCACGGTASSAAPESKPAQSEASSEAGAIDLSAMSQSELAEAMKPLLDAYSLCLAETFGAQYSEQSYIRLFESEEAAIADNLQSVRAIIPAADINAEDGKQKGGEYDGLAIDPSYGDCYPVSNFKSMAEIEAYLNQWLDTAVFAETLKNNFIEYDGALYLVRGGRGYGAENIKADTLQLTGAAGDGWTLTVDGCLFEERSDNVTLTVAVGENGALRMTNAVWEPIPTETSAVG